MANIRKDLIQNFLERKSYKELELIYKPLKLSNKFIDKLFNHYYCHEMCEFWYDSEPEYDDLEYDKYMTYCSILQGKYYNYCDEEYPVEELKRAYYHILQQNKDYESHRIEFNNWIEPYFKGNWGYTQKFVDDNAKYTLKKGIKRMGISLKDRLYYAKKDDQIRIYFYGRDLIDIDYTFIFLKRDKRRK